MSVHDELLARCEAQCELCRSDKNLSAYEVPPSSDGSADQSVMICKVCLDQIETPESMDANHWRCLNDTMWSQVPAVQVMVWRILQNLRAEGWPQDLLDMLYLEEETLAWAKEGQHEGEESGVEHRDSNGALLAAGDSVTLIKDLNVKGGGFTAKRGTTVRNISLVADNPEQIEGRVSGQQIVILTQFVKKA
ncbi:PhnA domain-containing protein [Desulfosediminicola ganghwensis]|uniref:PhnA domain-containing protein n=1 Tax=Desulfosediminicola ganghwensis TaxID=2569540 RepID=UPI0010AC3DA8|nr:alkylphosphonate utilization protein [Desulfosediminicola ganghwensis]